jgi:hypothetical protein
MIPRRVKEIHNGSRIDQQKQMPGDTKPAGGLIGVGGKSPGASRACHQRSRPRTCGSSRRAYRRNQNAGAAMPTDTLLLCGGKGQSFAFRKTNFQICYLGLPRRSWMGLRPKTAFAWRSDRIAVYSGVPRGFVRSQRDETRMRLRTVVTFWQERPDVGRSSELSAIGSHGARTSRHKSATGRVELTRLS